MLDLEDFAWFAQFAKRADREVSRARINTECLLEQVGVLSCDTMLPDRLRATYGDMRDWLASAMLAREDKSKFLYLYVYRSLHPKIDYGYSSSTLLENARDAIRRINSIGLQLNQLMNSLGEHLCTPGHPFSGLRDGSIELTVLFKLQPSPERRAFLNLPEPPYFEIPGNFLEFLDGPHSSSLEDDAQNWNEYCDSDHPLCDEYMGYLVYALLNHAHLPWQLLGRLHAVDVDVRIRASRTFELRSKGVSSAT